LHQKNRPTPWGDFLYARNLQHPQAAAWPPSSRQRAARRQKKPAAFRFRRGGESSISAGSFFLSKL